MTAFGSLEMLIFYWFYWSEAGELCCPRTRAVSVNFRAHAPAHTVMEEVPGSLSSLRGWACGKRNAKTPCAICKKERRSVRRGGWLRSGVHSQLRSHVSRGRHENEDMKKGERFRRTSPDGGWVWEELMSPSFPLRTNERTNTYKL